MSINETVQVNGCEYDFDVPHGPPERHSFCYTQYGQPERRVEMTLDGRDLAIGFVIGEFAAHLVACGYSSALVETYIPSWGNIRSPF